MLLKQEGSLVSLEGILNEHVDLEIIEDAIVQSAKSSQEGIVSLDLSQVIRANSSGLLLWLRMTKRIKCGLNYIRTPVWLVEQFNMIDEFFEGKISVESFFAHFYSEERDEIETRLLKVGSDVPVQDNYKNFNLTLTSADGKTLEPDFDERSYFHFIARHISKSNAKS